MVAGMTITLVVLAALTLVYFLQRTEPTGTNLMIDCPECQFAPIQTARRLWVVRSFILSTRYGDYTAVGCIECVTKVARRELFADLALGWWSAPGLLLTPYALLRTAPACIRRENRRELEKVLQAAFQVSVDDLNVGADGLSNSFRLMLRTVAAAIGKVAAVDGRSGDEWSAAIAALRDLSDGKLGLPEAEALLDQNWNRRIDPSELDREQRLVILHIAVAVADADDAVSPDEMLALRRVSMALGFDARLVDSLLVASEVNGSGEDAERRDAENRLGVEPNATIGEVRSAWKRLAFANHPDRATPEDRAAAHQKMVEINDAYEVLLGSSR